MMLRLKRAEILQRKPIIDNEVSNITKNATRYGYSMEMKLVSSGCHRKNVAEAATRNFKVSFLSFLTGIAEDFLPYLWDRLLPQAEITVNFLRLSTSNAPPDVSVYAHLSGALLTTTPTKFYWRQWDVQCR